MSNVDNWKCSQCSEILSFLLEYFLIKMSHFRQELITLFWNFVYAPWLNVLKNSCKLPTWWTGLKWKKSKLSYFTLIQHIGTLKSSQNIVILSKHLKECNTYSFSNFLPSPKAMKKRHFTSFPWIKSTVIRAYINHNNRLT